MTKEELKKIITENKEFILDRKGEIIKRESVQLPEKIKKVVVLYGVRRSGKTSLLLAKFLKAPSTSLYLDFEDERLTGFSLSDFELVKDSFFELNPHLIGKRVCFFLDEIQNVEGWEKFARRIVERENVDVFVAGSSSKLSPTEIHTSLRGREWTVEILPFSFREFLRARGIKTSGKIPYGRERIRVASSFEEYLKWGGFPEVAFAKSDFEKRKILNDYLDAMFFKDIVEKFNLTNIPLLETLKERLFSSFSSSFSVTSFYKKTKGLIPFSKDSLYTYYNCFLKSMLVYEARKFSDSIYVRMRNPAKIYLVDAGLARRVTSEDTGRLLENVVFLELRRRGYELYYFVNKRECDFIAQKGDGLGIFQVTARLTENNWEREVRGATSAAKFLRLKQASIITLEKEEEFEEKGLHVRVIPAWKWLMKGEC